MDLDILTGDMDIDILTGVDIIGAMAVIAMVTGTVTMMVTGIVMEAILIITTIAMMIIPIIMDPEHHQATIMLIQEIPVETTLSI